MSTRGRKSIRDDSNKDKFFVLRLTASERALFERYAKEKRIKLSEMLINAVYLDMLQSSYSIPITDIQTLERKLKRR